MSILVTFDRHEFYCTEEQADIIWAAKEAGRPVTLTNPHNGKVKWRGDAKAIAYIKAGGVDPDQPKLPAPPPPPPMTEEQLAQRRARLAKMREDFISRMKEKAAERKAKKDEEIRAKVSTP